MEFNRTYWVLGIEHKWLQAKIIPYPCTVSSIPEIYLFFIAEDSRCNTFSPTCHQPGLPYSGDLCDDSNDPDEYKTKTEFE